MAFARTIFVTVGDIPSTVIDRNSLVMGVDEPTTATTGTLFGVGLTPVTGNIVLSSPNTVYENVDLSGRISVTTHDVTIRNCIIRGDNTANALLTCTNSAALNVNVVDCEFNPQFARNDQNAFNGHDTNFLRCYMHNTVDIAQIQNSSLYSTFGAGWDCGVSFQQCLVGYMGWWTASAGGIVHPTDTETHNDVFQIFGGKNFRAQGNSIHAVYARQYGHWQVTSLAGPTYTTVPLNSLSDGGPWQQIPERGVTGGAQVSGTEANGRYNWDDLSGFMLNSSQGPTSDMLVTDNWCYGGQYFCNGGGNPFVSGNNLGQFLRNKFFTDTGVYGSTPGDESGHTLDFGGTYTEGVNVTAPSTGADKNYYVASGNGILVRA